MTRAEWTLTKWLVWIALAVGIAAAGEVVHAETQTGLASWYGREACQFNRDSRCPTASGKSLYDLERDGVLFAAMWDVPFGSRYRVCLEDDPTRCVMVEIWDRGPARRLKREIDLGKLAFAKLAPLADGVIQVTVEAVD